MSKLFTLGSNDFLETQPLKGCPADSKALQQHRCIPFADTDICSVPPVRRHDEAPKMPTPSGGGAPSLTLLSEPDQCNPAVPPANSYPWIAGVETHLRFRFLTQFVSGVVHEIRFTPEPGFPTVDELVITDGWVQTAFGTIVGSSDAVEVDGDELVYTFGSGGTVIQPTYEIIMPLPPTTIDIPTIQGGGGSTDAWVWIPDPPFGPGWVQIPDTHSAALVCVLGDPD